ncbi:MAG: hypothetical protein J1E05_01280 [Eubacterium sp.]|nr:hypothetical protein [Eubacterium sp.]
MEKKHFTYSVLAITIIIIAILFSACSIGKNADPNENTTNSESISNENTTEASNTTSENTTSRFTTRDCFVAQDDPIVIEYLESYDCTPGYVYFKKAVYGETKQLFEKKAKLMDIAELVSKVYVVTEDNEVVKVNKEDGTYETVYKARYGSINQISYDASNSKYILFDDGDYIIKLNPNNEEYSIATHSNNGISVIYGCSGDFDERGFYCKDCNEEFVVWEDADHNTYWYHPEKDENEEIDWSELYFGHPDEND